MDTKMPNLTDLANKFGTDKGTQIGNRHGYSAVYDKLFAPRQEDDIRLLEVGLSMDGSIDEWFSASRLVSHIPSIELWLAYFRRATVAGLDIADCSGLVLDPRFSFIRADCGDKEALRKAAKGRQFDIIIDDGSHASFHQQMTMLEFFPTLSSGGMYIVEDLDWQPDFEQTLPPVPKTADLFSWLATAPKAEWSAIPCAASWTNVFNAIKDIRVYRRSEIDAIAGIERYTKRPWWKQILRKKPQPPDPIKLAVITKL